MNVFVRVAECGSFSRAADSLGLANATVTAAIGSLERQLGVVLMRRNSRSLQLTDAGRLHLQRTRELLDRMAGIEDEVRKQLREARGRLHVEAPVSLAHALLCPRLPEFARRHPDIRTVLTMSNEPNNLIDSGVDVALRVGHVADAELVARPLGELRNVACCAPELAARLPGHPRDLDPHLCLGGLPEERFHARPWQLRRGAETVRIRPKGPLHSNTEHDLLIAARAGTGVVCVPELLAHQLLAAGSLTEVYADWTTPSRTLHVVMARSRVGSAKVRAFTDFLFDVVRLQHPTEDGSRACPGTRATAPARP